MSKVFRFMWQGYADELRRRFPARHRKLYVVPSWKSSLSEVLIRFATAALVLAAIFLVINIIWQD